MEAVIPSSAGASRVNSRMHMGSDEYGRALGKRVSMGGDHEGESLGLASACGTLDGRKDSRMSHGHNPFLLVIEAADALGQLGGHRARESHG